MQLSVDFGLDQILNVIRVLPINDVTRIKIEIDNRLLSDIDVKNNMSEFQRFLLNYPVMTDEQFKEFKETRKRFNKWKIE